MGFVRNPFLGSYTLVDKCREGKCQLEARPRFQIFRPRLVDTLFVGTKIETFKKNTENPTLKPWAYTYKVIRGFGWAYIWRA